ncbi:MAG: hypothetical protein P9L88_04920 [Candidatus Tantalella remota]|nr:hypothetical protein [Candidatus Tantalella remota]
MVWIEFAVCGALLTVFAYNLCKEGVILSEKTHLEEGVIGMFFLAAATSFPEIATGATAVFSLDMIGLGYGDLAGSIIVNLMILFALDVYCGRGRILLKVSRLNRLTGIFVLVAASVVLSAALLRTLGISLSVIGMVGVESIVLVGVYFAYLKVISRKGPPKHKEIHGGVNEPFWRIWSKFILLLVIVMFLGMWMAKIGEKIVLSTTLSQTFTGTLLLGFATSLPEIIVSFAAIRASSVDMAVGNILGSNLFDICVVALLDILTKVPILGALTSGQVLSTVVVLVLSGIAVAGLFSRRDNNRRVSWDTSLIFAVGLAGFVILYFIK